VIALFVIAWLVSVVLYRRMFADERRRAADALVGADATEAA
jgi:nickel/cobalt transporter (NiCoT) family protein